MGDPKKSRKKYSTPGHPYEAERIKEENRLLREFGLSNKKEIWKVSSILKKWREQARSIIALSDEERDIEEQKLVQKLNSLGILPKESRLDDVLALELRTILERRLQTQVYKMGLSNSIKQARQFILHRKVTVNGKKITSPACLIKKADTIRLIGSFRPKLKDVVLETKKISAPKTAQNQEKVAEEVKNGN